MTGYILETSREADKFFEKNKIEGQRIKKNFAHIAENPFDNIKLYDIKLCKGSLYGLMRLRTGKYRAIFKIINARLVIYVIKVDSRGDVYKK